MKSAIGIVAHLTILAAALIGGACTQSQAGPDLILHHAAVHTMDPRQPFAEAVAVTGGRITFVGSDSDALKLVSRNTRVIDAGGRLLLPGFIDTHVHPVEGGLRLGECDLHDIMTRDSLFRAIVECARRNPTAAWVRGGGFELPLFPDGNPSRLLLDSLVPDRPAFLTSTDEHNAWANSRALAVSGVTRDAKDPPHGRIERDAAGNPSGTLREAAQDLVASHLPAYADADHDAALERAMALANRFGITTWHEANADEAIVRAYHRADSLGTLTVRTVVALHVDPDRGTAQIPILDSLRRRYGTSLVQVTAAKIFVDGVIEGHTAVVLQPYLDRPGFRGQLKVSPGRARHARARARFRRDSRCTCTPSATGPSAPRSTHSRNSTPSTAAPGHATSSPISSSSIPRTFPDSPGSVLRPHSSRSGHFATRT